MQRMDGRSRFYCSTLPIASKSSWLESKLQLAFTSLNFIPTRCIFGIQSKLELELQQTYVKKNFVT